MLTASPDSHITSSSATGAAPQPQTWRAGGEMKMGSKLNTIQRVNFVRATGGDTRASVPKAAPYQQLISKHSPSSLSRDKYKCGRQRQHHCTLLKKYHFLIQGVRIRAT